MTELTLELSGRSKNSVTLVWVKLRNSFEKLLMQNVSKKAVKVN